MHQVSRLKILATSNLSSPEFLEWVVSILSMGYRKEKLQEIENGNAYVEGTPRYLGNE